MTAHVRDLSILSRPAGEAGRAFFANLRDYAALFFVRGDVLPRHGDPDRPVVLAGVGALLVAGAAVGVARAGVERLFLAPIAVFLAGGLLARDTESANASRVSLAAPFVLTLAALGAAALAESLPARDRRASSAALLGLVLVTAILDASGFVRWVTGPHVVNSFGVAERRLTDAIETQRRRAPSEVLVHPVRAARNVYFVDVLLGRPNDGGRHAVRIGTAGVETAWTRVPESDVLFAADGSPEVRRTMASLHARLVAHADPEDGGLPWLSISSRARRPRSRPSALWPDPPPYPRRAGTSSRPKTASTSSRREAECGSPSTAACSSTGTPEARPCCASRREIISSKRNGADRPPASSSWRRTDSPFRWETWIRRKRSRPGHDADLDTPLRIEDVSALGRRVVQSERQTSRADQGDAQDAVRHGGARPDRHGQGG